MHKGLEVNLCGVTLKNPVIGASGTFGYGKEYEELYDISVMGAICSKGLTLHKKEGNSGIRTYETKGGLLNSVGLQNPGVDAFIETELDRMLSYDTVTIVNLGGGSLEEYLMGLEKLNKTKVPLIELNISCPNVKSGGMAFGIKSEVAYEVVKEAKKVSKKPLIVKLSPNAEDIVDMALSCEKAGADALSLVNTFKGMAIDIQKRKPIFDNVTAGFSGPAIKPIALRMVYEVKKAVSVPVVGIGGIVSAEDAIEFIMAGAEAVEIGSGNFMNPLLGKEIVENLEKWMNENGVSSLREIRGII